MILLLRRGCVRGVMFRTVAFGPRLGIAMTQARSPSPTSIGSVLTLGWSAQGRKGDDGMLAVIASAVLGDMVARASVLRPFPARALPLPARRTHRFGSIAIALPANILATRSVAVSLSAVTTAGAFEGARPLRRALAFNLC